ncbi:MAG: hypothetical protein HQL16_01540 [Candidatus Omnitrophica bacterium]|nr:hypothetical protein [Candidatus Omnitrophota bacterium]
MTSLTQVFNPAFMKGMRIDPTNPFKFDFLIYRGDEPLTEEQKESEYPKLIKYFLTALAVPDTDQWVNLSPYEKERIIPDNFGLTEMGRDLLAQDYLLKQISASLIHPDTDLGKKFWKEVYQTAYQKFGTTDIPTDTFHKVWIVPDKAVIYEKGNNVYVLSNHLKVLLDKDYLATQKNVSDGNPVASQEASEISEKVMRQVLIPAIEKEVNEGRNFAPLRQVYSGMLLATWYKQTLKESILSKIYADKGKIRGVDQNPANNKEIYDQYIIAFQKGVFNMIKEDLDQLTQELIPRKYFSGGTVNDYAQKGVIQRAGSSETQKEFLQNYDKMDMAQTVLTEPQRAFFENSASLKSAAQVVLEKYGSRYGLTKENLTEAVFLDPRERSLLLTSSQGDFITRMGDKDNGWRPLQTLLAAPKSVVESLPDGTVMVAPREKSEKDEESFWSFTNDGSLEKISPKEDSVHVYRSRMRRSAAQSQATPYYQHDLRFFDFFRYLQELTLSRGSLAGSYWGIKVYLGKEKVTEDFFRQQYVSAQLDELSAVVKDYGKTVELYTGKKVPYTSLVRIIERLSILSDIIDNENPKRFESYFEALKWLRRSVSAQKLHKPFLEPPFDSNIFEEMWIDPQSEEDREIVFSLLADEHYEKDAPRFMDPVKGTVIGLPEKVGVSFEIKTREEIPGGARIMTSAGSLYSVYEDVLQTINGPLPAQWAESAWVRVSDRFYFSVSFLDTWDDYYQKYTLAKAQVLLRETEASKEASVLLNTGVNIRRQGLLSFLRRMIGIVENIRLAVGPEKHSRMQALMRAFELFQEKILFEKRNPGQSYQNNEWSQKFEPLLLGMGFDIETQEGRDIVESLFSKPPLSAEDLKQAVRDSFLKQAAAWFIKNALFVSVTQHQLPAEKDRNPLQLRSPLGEAPSQGVVLQEKNNTDAAALTKDVYGGISLSQSTLDMEIKRDGKGVVLPVSQQDFDNIHIDGLVPVILDIKPVNNNALIFD